MAGFAGWMRVLALAALALPAALGMATAQTVAAPAGVDLWRLDCGSLRVDDLNDFSDTAAYTGRSMTLVASCYLIRHGQTWMLWDTGLPKSALGAALTGPDAKEESLSRTLADQLAEKGVRPDDISLIGLSHYHYDHTGQAVDFPGAKLLMGAGDVAMVKAPDGARRAAPIEHWITGGGALDAVTGDYDVFGDGSVIMLNLPGHTPGHHGLLVRRPGGDHVLLSGDAAHFRENLESGGLPSWNTDRADSLAAMDRLKALARNLKATLVIQHDPRDRAKVRPFSDR